MKQIKNYDGCELEIIRLDSADIITSSGGINGDEDNFGFDTGDTPYGNYEW